MTIAFRFTYRSERLKSQNIILGSIINHWIDIVERTWGIVILQLLHLKENYNCVLTLRFNLKNFV